MRGGGQISPCQKWGRGGKIFTPSFLDSLILTEPEKVKKKFSKEILRNYIPYRTLSVKPVISHNTGPGFKTRLVRYFLLSFRLILTYQYHNVERSLMYVESSRRISRSGLSQVIKMGSCISQCDVPHQWMDILCLHHGIPVWQHIGQSTTAKSRHRRDMTSDV